MIKSILDNDLYKFTMQQAVHRLYPWAEAQYVFINRGGADFPEGFGKKLQGCINAMADLRLSDEEATYLATTCDFLSPVYIDYLKSYRYDPHEVGVEQRCDELILHVRGPWYRTILWEVPLMAMISELYCKNSWVSHQYTDEKCSAVNTAKAERFVKEGVKLADFGTRRRFSFANQDKVIQDFLSVSPRAMLGTSNVYFARKHEIKPIGTHAHEWFMFHGAVNGYRMANQTAMDAWSQVYQGDLGIALTDTYTTDVFFDSFDSVKARLFDGVRHDSGDPIIFANKVIDHYLSLGINPAFKTIVFSDSLTTEKAVMLNSHCKGKIKCSFGIGTHLTNDVGIKALNMVIKLSRCKPHPNTPWMYAVKLSDSTGKHTGDASEVNLCVQTLVF
jgi:nicotinate phosphoribosyltransferase